MIKKILLFLIKIYQLFLSSLIGSNCRFYPTCSNYAIQAIKTYSILYAIKLILIRVIRCNPWGGSGIDLLPERNAKNKN
tara:strand:+ start:326 stop:562 length:237 start_codon:yes stop_codon:yes gene_type:complete